MEIVKCRMPESMNASIFILSDVHKGSSGHNREAFKRAVETIEKTSQKRAVSVMLNGDLCDCVDFTDKRFNPDEVCEHYKVKDLKDLPKKQADELIEDMQPVKHLVTHTVIGNHEESYIKRHSFNVYNYYSYNLNNAIQLGKRGIVKFVIGKQKHDVVIDVGIAHGAGGGGRMMGYPLNFVRNIWDVFDVDLAVAGHIHSLVTRPFQSVRVNRELRLVKRNKYLAVAGCFLDTYVKGGTNYFEGSGGLLPDIVFLEFTVDRKRDDWETNIIEHRL